MGELFKFKKNVGYVAGRNPRLEHTRIIMMDISMKYQKNKLKRLYKMKILGLNLNHADTSACIIVNGKIIAAIEEKEKFVRIKHYAGFPKNSIDFVLKASNFKLSEIDFITVNYSSSANLKEKNFLYN